MAKQKMDLPQLRRYVIETAVRAVKDTALKAGEASVRQVSATYTTEILKTLSKLEELGLAYEIMRIWTGEVNQRVAKASSRQAYLKGIEEPTVDKGKITLRLRGFEAVKVERGWAPPQTRGGNMADGIGTYTGRPMDMRPLLLYSGSSPQSATHDTYKSSGKSGGTSWKKGDVNPKTIKPTGTGATVYKTIQLPVSEGDVPTTMASFALSVANWLQDAHTQRAQASLDHFDHETKRRRNHDKVIAGLSEQLNVARTRDAENLKLWASLTRKLLSDSRNEGSAMLRTPKTFPRTYKTAFKDEETGDEIPAWHRRFMYNQMTATPVKAGKQHMDSLFKFSTLRTISDSPRQMGLRRWFTPGTPPVGIFDKEAPIMTKIAQAIVDAVTLRATWNTKAAKTNIDAATRAQVEKERAPSLTKGMSDDFHSTRAATASEATPGAQPAAAQAPGQRPVMTAEPAATQPTPSLSAPGVSDEVSKRAREMFNQEYGRRGSDTTWNAFRGDFETRAQTELAKPAVATSRSEWSREDRDREDILQKEFVNSRSISGKRGFKEDF